jgi:hypothetical protein
MQSSASNDMGNASRAVLERGSRDGEGSDSESESGRSEAWRTDESLYGDPPALEEGPDRTDEGAEDDSTNPNPPALEEEPDDEQARFESMK